MTKNNFFKPFFLFFFILFLFSIAYLSLGDKNYALTNLFDNPIVMSLRFPRLISLYFVGMLLSISGLLVQTMTRNPIAEMSTLGISGGASFALSILLTFGLSTSDWWSALIASIGALLSLILVMIFTAKSRFQPLKVVLVGTSIGLFTTSLASSLTFYSNNTQSYFLWIVGSFSGITPLKVDLLAITTLVFLVVTFIFANQIKLLALGDEMATSLGISVNFIRVIIMILVALASGITVSSVGVISFVGLISPHISKRFVGGYFWKNLILSSLIGMTLLVIADLLARNLFKPYEFPAGSLIMLIGAPFFISIISKEAK